MKPPNHGKRVEVQDSFLTFRGWLLYTPETRGWAYYFGVPLNHHQGLSIREYYGSVSPLLRGDRITLLP